MPKRSSVSPERNRNKRRKSLTNDESCTVFVGNLRFETRWQALKDHMRRAGNVDSATILEDRQTKRSKGCGIVTYQDPRDAARAIRELNETNLDGRTIFVQPDKGGREDRGSNFVHDNNNGGGDERALYVGNLSFDCTWKDLKDKFQDAGYVDQADVMMFANNNRSKGFGKVVFSHPRDAQNAIRRYDGTNFQGRALIVKSWGNRGSGGTGGGFDDNKGGRGSNSGGKVYTLYVGNLDFDCRPRDLRNLLGRFGRIANVEIAQTGNGKSKGFAFVDFGLEKDAQKALSQMDGSTFQGRPLKVKWDRDSKGGGASKEQSYDDGLPNTTIHVGNLDFDCRWQDLKDLCKKFGQVEHVEIAESSENKRSKGWGTVQFLTSAQAQRAIDQLDGTEFQSRNITCKWDRKKGAPAGGMEDGSGNDNKKKKKKSEGGDKPKPKKTKPEPPAPTLDGALSATR